MELARFPSRGGFSVRSIITFALAVIATVLLWTIIGGAPAHAADASWSGSSIKYQGQQYISAGKVQKDDGTGLAVDSPYYIYTENSQTTDASVGNLQKAHIIYFTPGTDPPSATNASYATYDYNLDTKTFSNPRDQKSITLDPTASNNGGSSCVVAGIGWIVCPVMTFLSNGMDVVFGFIADFMKVQPLQTGNTNGSLYTAWNIMRSIANVAFIIGFIIIIYSQLTNIQVNNYGLKRLLPRLIIAAVAINLSYLICAIAVDLSNVLGYALDGVFKGLEHQILASGNTDNSGAILSWQSVTGFVISGGSAALAGGIATATAISVAGGTTAAAMYILLPALVGLILAVLVVLLILAARQALIVILVIIAPLALVAYLLPNTEKWFKRWRELFMTMLIFFPAFAVVFGGSQLAGAIIIKNATSINTIILGMIVQVAPLVITPLLLKFSGSVLGNIAKLVNNPNKGIIDRTRKWSQARADYHRKRGISGAHLNGNPGELKGRNVLRRSARYLDQRTRRLGDRTKNAEMGAQTAYENSRLYNKPGRYNIAVQTAAFEDDKTKTHNRHAIEVEHARVHAGSLLYDRTLNVEASKEGLEASQADTKAHLNRQRTMGGSALNYTTRQLELSKAELEITENDKNIYINQERMRHGSQLNAVVDTLEASKLHLEGSQQRYTAMVDKMKVDPSNALHLASQVAQAGKEHAESAQLRVQAMFDAQRTNEDGNVLNVSAVELAASKVIAERGQSDTTVYLNNLKETKGTTIHWQTVKAAEAKQQAQISETSLARMIDEYKSGALDTTGLSTQEIALMNQMAYDTETLAAEARGSQAAQDMQKERIARAFTEMTTDSNGNRVRTARAEELIKLAQSVDPYGDVRAEASSLSTLNDIVAKARTANELLLETRAETDNKTPKNYALELLQARIDGDMSESEDLIRAAMEIAGKEAQIPIIRKMRMSHNFNQDDLSAMLLRNSGTMKVKGGFDLQNDTGLVYASQELMDASTAGTIGSTAPDQFKDLKNGAMVNYADRMDKIMEHTTEMLNSTASDPETRKKEQKYGREGTQGIQKTYFNLTTALNDPQIRRTLGDNFIPAIQMHYKIHHNPRFHNEAMDVDYAAIDPQNLAGIR